MLGCKPKNVIQSMLFCSGISSIQDCELLDHKNFHAEPETRAALKCVLQNASPVPYRGSFEI